MVSKVPEKGFDGCCGNQAKRNYKGSLRRV